MMRLGLLLCLGLCLPAGVAAADGRGVGHVGLVVVYDSYESGRLDEGADTQGASGAPDDFNSGATLRYVYDPGERLAWMPAVGLGLTRWKSEVEGDCCGFPGTDVRSTFESVDLIIGTVATKDDIREVWYVLAGTTTADIDIHPEMDQAGGISAGSQSGNQFGLGFFAGEAGGFSGGVELRFTRFSDFDLTTVGLSLGVGF